MKKVLGSGVADENTIIIKDYQNSQYYGAIEVGSPGQTINVFRRPAS